MSESIVFLRFNWYWFDDPILESRGYLVISNSRRAFYPLEMEKSVHARLLVDGVTSTIDLPLTLYLQCG